MAMENEELGEILDKIDIESWLDSEGVRYRVTRGTRGTQLNVKECPSCGNSNYKVYLNQDNGLGNCFAGDCERRFNKFSFIRAWMGNASNRDVIEHIKAVARSHGWRPARVQSMAVNLKTDLVIPESVALPVGGRNLKYLENRGVTPDIARYFALRFCNHGGFNYVDDAGRKLHQDYSKRVIIPIFDLNGDLVSFQGRDITGKADKKYLFPPGFSSTGAHLYNGHNAHGCEHVVIGEGAFDVIATKIALDGQTELRNIVPIGSFGKHLSSGDDNSQFAKLLQLKEGGLKIVTIMWDSEEKAIEAAVNTALMLRRYGFVARVAILPKDKDPNEVPPSVVRAAFWKAEAINESVAVRLRLAKRLA
jgi:DNA primase